MPKLRQRRNSLGQPPVCRSGDFPHANTGIAVAIIVHGKVLTGAHGACGEIGYSLRGIPEEGGFAEGHAPLEEAVGGRDIGENVGRKLLGRGCSAADASPPRRARPFLLIKYSPSLPSISPTSPS